MAIERWTNSGTKLQNVLVLSDESNYHQWSSAAKVYLDDAEVWELVDGIEPKPDVDPHSNWARKNKAARVILMQLVAPAHGTGENVADLMTKSLVPVKHIGFTQQLGII